MEFSIRKLLNEFSRPRYVYRVCFRHSANEPWTRVLGTDDYTTMEKAEEVLAEVEGRK